MPTGNTRLYRNRPLYIDIDRLDQNVFVALYHSNRQGFDPKLLKLSFIEAKLREIDPSIEFDVGRGWRLNFGAIRAVGRPPVIFLARAIRTLLEEKGWFRVVVEVSDATEFQAVFEYKPSFS